MIQKLINAPNHKNQKKNFRVFGLKKQKQKLKTIFSTPSHSTVRRNAEEIHKLNNKSAKNINVFITYQ